MRKRRLTRKEREEIWKTIEERTKISDDFIWFLKTFYPEVLLAYGQYQRMEILLSSYLRCEKMLEKILKKNKEVK